MGLQRHPWIVALVVLVVVALIAGGLAYAAIGWPAIPAGTAATRIAVAQDTDAAKVPDPPADASDPSDPILASACLDRITRPGGWLDLCWGVSRMTAEVDPAKDYYVLQVKGTLSGNQFPSGLRWAVVRARLDPASDPVEDIGDWPGPDTFDGPCRDTEILLDGPFATIPATVCGRTTGLVDATPGSSSGVAWTCAGCLPALSRTQEILLVSGVTVAEGKTPIWDLYADLGS